jgi:hypothetical protein
MKHRWYVAGLVVVVLALGGAWFLTNYEQVSTKVWVGPTAAARANPYLAAMRFAERLSIETRFVTGNRSLGELNPQGAVLLPNQRTGLTPETLRALERWIHKGGHAIVEPEPEREIDTVLDRYGITRTVPKTAPKEPTQDLVLTGWSDPIVVSRAVGPDLKFDKHTPDIVASDDAGPSVASIPIGAGRLTVVTGMPRRFHNRSIGQHDNAELLRRILGFTPVVRELAVLRVPQALPLWGWLGEHALPTLGAAAVLLLLGLARALPRFGPIMPQAQVARRQLREHILAAGRFRWTHGGRDGLLSAAREIASRQIALMHPRIAQMPVPGRWHELAKRTGLDAASIAGAFDTDVRSAREFVQAIDTLASIHASIGARTESRS